MFIHLLNWIVYIKMNFQPTLGLLGLVGNVLSILVLSSKEMNNFFNRLLIALTIFDSIFILFVILDYSFVRGLLNRWILSLNSIVWFQFGRGHLRGTAPSMRTSSPRYSTLWTISPYVVVSTPLLVLPGKGNFKIF